MSVFRRPSPPVRRRVGSLLASLVVPAALLSCARPPPPVELHAARAAIERARTSPTVSFALPHLSAAEAALEKAERAAERAPGDPRTRDLAYLALRYAEYAEKVGMLVADHEAVETARRMLRRAEAMAAAREAEARRAAAERAKQAEAEAEAEERERLDRSVRRAMGRGAEVRREERGTIIALPGTFVVSGGQVRIRHAVRAQLDRLANELIRNPSRTVTIEIYADESLPAERARELTEQRAGLIQSYLENRGVSSDRIRSVTVESLPGEARGEGGAPPRGARRRELEIVVEPSRAAERRETPPPPEASPPPASPPPAPEPTPDVTSPPADGSPGGSTPR